MNEDMKEMNWLDNEIDKWWCAKFIDYKMKRVTGHKFIPDPAFVNETHNQAENGRTRIAYELELDWQVDSDAIDWDDATIREFAKYFYNLGLQQSTSNNNNNKTKHIQQCKNGANTLSGIKPA